MIKNSWCENVTAHHGVAAWGFGDFGFFNDIRDGPGPIRMLRGVDDAVAGNVLQRHFLHPDNTFSRGFKSLDERFERGAILVENIISQQERKGFRSHGVPRAEHRVAETQGLALPDESELAKARDGPHLLEIIGLAPSEQHVLQLVGHVEMILDGLFAATGDEHKVFYTRADGFFHDILDDGLVHQGQHFFGLGLGRG